MNLSRLGLVFVIVFGLIVLIEIRWFLGIYRTDVLVPVVIFAVIAGIWTVLLRRYVDEPTSLGQQNVDEGE